MYLTGKDQGLPLAQPTDYDRAQDNEDGSAEARRPRAKDGTIMIGQRISHFRILDKIGEGGMGIVYLAEDTELHRRIALKVLRRDFVTSEKRRARFFREGRTAAKINHPSIATIHEIGEEGGEIFIAMEYVEGRALNSQIAGKPLPVARATEIAIQIADGLAAAHRSQIIHRDLKPANVVLDADHRVKILDFGLAKLLEADEEGLVRRGEETVSGLISQEGRILGTVAYMSPEQARGKPVDARSDIFSFGITLYEMVTGRAPFHGETPSDTLASILREDPDPPVQVNPEVPPELAQIITKCLKKDPAERYQNARDLATDLRRLLSGSISQSITLDSDPGFLQAPSGIGSAPGRPLRRKGLLLPLAGILTVALVAFLTLGLPHLLGRSGVPPAAETIENSLAVMAFQNLKDPEDPDRLGQILQELIITDLSGLSPLKVFSSQRLYDIRKQLGGSGQGQYEREIASEIARRAGAHTILQGSLSQLGSNWTVTAQLIDAGEGTVVASQRIDGTDLYAMVDDLTDRLRDDLQVTMRSKGPATVASVREKTTSSLTAYRLYLAGADLLNRGMYEAAAETLSTATDIDPSFGQAYYKQAMAIWWAGHDPKAAKQQLNRILTDQLYSSRLERLMAEAGLSLIGQDWEKGKELYRQVTEQFPDEKEGWYGLGEALFHSKGTTHEETIEAFERAIALDPSFALAYRHVLDIATYRGEHDKAIRRVKKFIDSYPDNPIGYGWWVQIATRWGHEEEIDAALEAARVEVRKPDELRAVLVDAANGYSSRQDIVKAREILEEARRIDPEGIDLSWYSLMVKTLYELQERGEAQDLIDEFAERYPEMEEEANAGRIELLIDTGDLEEAIDLAASYACKPSEKVECQIVLSKAYARAGRFSEIERLRDSLQTSAISEKSMRKFLQTTAWSLFQEKQFDRSRSWMEEAMKRSAEESLPEERFELGWILARTGDLAEAEAIFRDGLGSDTRKLDAQLGLVAVSLLRGDYVRVEQMARDLLEKGYAHAELHALLSYALIEQDRCADAIPHARRFVEMTDSHIGLLLLSWALIESGAGIEEGIALAERARDEVPLRHSDRVWILPFTPSVEHCLGLGFLKLGRATEAVAMLEKAAGLRPDRKRIVEDLARAKNLL